MTLEHLLTPRWSFMRIYNKLGLEIMKEYWLLFKQKYMIIIQKVNVKDISALYQQTVLMEKDTTEENASNSSRF